MTSIKRGIVAGSLFLTWLSGCASHIAVRPDEPMNNDRVFNYRQVNERIEWRRVDLRCVNGTQFSADSLVVGDDSTSFVDASSGTVMRVPTRSVKSVARSVKDPPAVYIGIAAGGGAGLLSGVGVLLLTVSHRGGDEAMGAGVLLLGFTAAGAIIGGVIGGNGRDEVFEFTPRN